MGYYDVITSLLLILTFKTCWKNTRGFIDKIRSVYFFYNIRWEANFRNLSISILLINDAWNLSVIFSSTSVSTQKSHYECFIFTPINFNNVFSGLCGAGISAQPCDWKVPLFLNDLSRVVVWQKFEISLQINCRRL